MRCRNGGVVTTLVNVITICLLCTSAFSQSTGAPNGADSISFISATPPSGTPLPSGSKLPINVTIQYTLTSQKSAILTLSTAQFRTVDSCSGSGELVDLVPIKAKRGTHTVTIPITWSGDTAQQYSERQFRRYGQGSLSFSAAFWRVHSSVIWTAYPEYRSYFYGYWVREVPTVQTKKEMLNSFSFAPSYCSSFSPSNPPVPQGDAPKMEAPIADSVRLVSATPVSGSELPHGQNVPINLVLEYSLVSHKNAMLSVSTAQFRQPGMCKGPGELVDAVEVPIKRGTHTITVPINWSGDTGEKSKGRIFGKGSLSFMAMFWEKSPHRPGRPRYAVFSLYDAYCSSF